jgi:PglZ domain
MNWRYCILKEFTPQVAPLTLVTDPDCLLTEAGMLRKIQERGFEVFPFEDAIAFRCLYESHYRPRLQRGEILDLVVVFKAETQELQKLPYDILKTQRKLTFSLGNLFPNLSYTVVNALDRSDFDALYQAQIQYNPQDLGENATKDFVLRYVFNIDPDFIQKTSDLLLILLRRHSRNQHVPTILDERLIQIVRERRLFSTLPLETIIPDRQAFFSFLQQNWLSSVTQLTKSPQVSEATGIYITSANLPFDNEDIRLYINNLFLEGYLQPINADELGITTTNLQSNPWMKVGLCIDPKTEKLRRLQDLIQFIDDSIPDGEGRYQDWLKFAQTWAELITLWHEDKLLNLENLFIALQKKVDNAFLNWINLHYGALYNQVANTPVMLHQIPRFIERHLEASKTNKAALIVLDGLAFDQWLILRKVLLAQRPHLRLRDETVFAWLPTITSVSRQAIFAGKPPAYFSSSLDSTTKEESLWKQYWTERNFNTLEVAYLKGLGEANSVSLVEEKLSPKIRVLGLVVDKVDKIMHGMQLGTAGMHNQVRQWAELGFMSNLLDLLLNNGFQIFLTSDHGNIEATGMGQPKEGATADLRGERVRVYPDSTLRTNVKNQFPSAIEWQNLGLPAEYLPLLAPSRQAFIREAEKIVAHGGASVEELIVPFISISSLTR